MWPSPSTITERLYLRIGRQVGVLERRFGEMSYLSIRKETFSDTFW